jgi:hypothetical protein
MPAWQAVQLDLALFKDGNLGLGCWQMAQLSCYYLIVSMTVVFICCLQVYLYQRVAAAAVSCPLLLSVGAGIPCANTGALLGKPS